MSLSDEKDDRLQRFAKIWWKSRTDAKKSQEYMALNLGVSKRTVQNWERGTSSPDFFQSAEWFRLLGQNPIHYYLEFLYPSLFENLSPAQDDAAISEKVLFLVENMTPVEKRQLLYLMDGNHGSSWYSLLQMFTAHCHTSMKSRVAAARVIAENYEMEAKSGDLVCPENIQPDMDVLNFAISQGKQAAQDRKMGYTTQK